MIFHILIFQTDTLGKACRSVPIPHRNRSRAVGLVISHVFRYDTEPVRPVFQKRMETVRRGSGDTYTRKAVLSAVRTTTSSRQSPKMSPCKQGLLFDPLLKLHPSNVASGRQAFASQSYLLTVSWSSISRSKSPSHHTAMFIGKPRGAAQTTSPFIFRMPPEADDHISTP